MLIHAVLALNWSNYLLKESIKGILSILQIGFSKVKLNWVPFQLITKFCLTCFKNGQKKYTLPTHAPSPLVNQGNTEYKVRKRSAA